MQERFKFIVHKGRLEEVDHSATMMKSMAYEIRKIHEQENQHDVILQTGAAVGYMSALVDLGVIDIIGAVTLEGIIKTASDERIKDIEEWEKASYKEKPTN
jgi:hypothetical protein